MFTNENKYKLRNEVLNDDENLLNRLILDVFRFKIFKEMEHYLTFFYTSNINLDYMFCNLINMLKLSTEVKSNVLTTSIWIKQYCMNMETFQDTFFVVCSEISSRFLVSRTVLQMRLTIEI